MISKAEYEKIGAEIVDVAFSVHRKIGSGLRVSVCEICLVEELRNRNY